MDALAQNDFLGLALRPLSRNSAAEICRRYEAASALWTCALRGPVIVVLDKLHRGKYSYDRKTTNVRVKQSRYTPLFLGSGDVEQVAQVAPSYHFTLLLLALLLVVFVAFVHAGGSHWVSKVLIMHWRNMRKKRPLSLFSWPT